MNQSRAAWLLRASVAAAFGALYFTASIESKTADLKPYMLQMHVHGSMSEGPGSMRGANVHAKKIGLDVLWWSDHDWRMAYHTYSSGYDFEADDLSKTVPVPYPPGADSSRAREQEMDVTLEPSRANGDVLDGVARITAERASQGKKSLEIAAGAQSGAFQNFFYTIDASRRRLKRSLASRVSIKISIYPDQDPDKETMAGLRVDLSQQPPDMAQGAICYVLTGLSDAELAALSTPHLKFVRLDFKPRQWNTYTLDLTGDATRLGLGGGDNALVDASFGVMTRGKRVRAFFDDYRIAHRIQSEALRDEARRMAAELQKEYGVINYVGQELSYNAHLNPLGLHIPMIDYTKHPEGLDGPETADFVHRNGGIASVNHIFGTSAPPKGLNPKDPESVRKFEDRRIAELIANRCEHADILEVGYPVRVLPMKSFLRVWDALSNAGVYVVGNGTSDTHSSNGGWFNGNNFISWVYAESASQADLIEGFRRGSVYFGDPVKFKGRVMLTTDDGHQMGQVVITRKPSHQVRIHIEGLPAGSKVRTVTNGDYGADFSAGASFDRSVPVETAKAGFFRVESYSAEGRPLAFSNPIYFTPTEPSDKIGAEKRVVCR